jgi:hypothetical protein
MKKSPKSKKLRTLSIGSVVASTLPGPMGTVLVKVVATNITAPLGNGATCTPTAATAFLKRFTNGSWVDDAPSQQMTGNATSGYETIFPPRAPGLFKGLVNLHWQISYMDQGEDTT